MAITYDWTVSQLDCYPQAEGQTDVVFVVHWRCNGTDGTYSGMVYATTGVTYEAGTPYTPFADLTQDQVLGWVWATGPIKESAEANIARQIENQINPPVVALPPPWNP